MISQTKSIMIKQSELVSAVEKLTPAAGDVFLFFIKTDDQGLPFVEMDVAQQTADMIGEIFEESGAKAIFLFDKICLFSVGDSERMIKSLKNCISTIEGVVDQVPDIENGNLGDPVTIEMEEAQDQFKRVL